jgi:hypothetical protein
MTARDNKMTIGYISAVLETHSHTNFLVEVLRRSMLEDSAVEGSDGTAARLVNGSKAQPSIPESGIFFAAEDTALTDDEPTQLRYSNSFNGSFALPPGRMARICSSSDIQSGIMIGQL